MNGVELLANLGKNLEIERVQLGFTRAVFADKLGITLSSYRRIIEGQTSKVDLEMLCRFHKLTGKFIAELCEEYSEPVTLIQKYRILSENQKTFVRAVVEFENRFRLENADYEDYITVFIPTGDMKDGMIYDSSKFEKLNIAKYRKLYGDRIHYGMKVTSNHLHPTYNLGDILLITKEPIRDGDMGLFLNRETGKAHIRKFHQGNPCVLEPVNDFGIPIEVNPNDKSDMDKWVKFGRIITKFR